MSDTKLVSLRIPVDVLETVDRVADVERRSRAQVIINTLRDNLQGVSKADLMRVEELNSKFLANVDEKAGRSRRTQTNVAAAGDKVTVATQVPEPREKSGITDTVCQKPNHLTFKSGDRFFCLTCSKEQ